MIIKSEGGEGELVEKHAIMVSGCFLPEDKINFWKAILMMKSCPQLSSYLQRLVYTKMDNNIANKPNH
jgi:hypothetical protein